MVMPCAAKDPPLGCSANPVHGHVILPGCAFPCGLALVATRTGDVGLFSADVLCVPGLLPRFRSSSECGGKMKEHRKAFGHKGGQLLVLKQSWVTPLSIFRRFFQNRQNVFFQNRWLVKSSGCLRKKNHCVNIRQAKRKLVSESLSSRKQSSKHGVLNRRPRCKSARVCRFQYKSRPRWTPDGDRNGTENPLNPKGPSNHGRYSKNILSLGIKKGVLETAQQDAGVDTLVTLNSCNKLPSRVLKQRCFDGLWLSRTCNLFASGKVPLFMMHKKLSAFTVCGRVQFQKLRARNRCFKLVDISRPWIQKVFWKSCRKSLRSKVYKAISYLKSKIQRPVQYISRAFDMNNKTLGVLCASQQCTTNTCLSNETVNKLEGFPSQVANVASSKPMMNPILPQMLSSGTQWDNGASQLRKHSDSPILNTFPDDVYILVTEKEVSISCQDDHDAPAEGSDELMLLTPDKLKLGANENAEYHDSLLMDIVENGEDSSHMSAEDPTNTDFCNTKLLDHPYCKSSPPLGSSLEAELEASVKRELKNGKKITSGVPDEQLALCLSGLLNETIKKYGSLIPLTEKDILTRLKDVFKEDFSNRISFITKEIMKYRTKHSKAALCNFRVHYNKHMLDMDDLATLDGQNWLNDQVINMYGELIMDAVPEKVHFLNSFFHRQLVTKGYNGVKRWTKKVDFFKKSLLLIPIHLEVHWSLITVNIPNKIISFYDSQGIHFKFCVENIRKYLLTEAREKNHAEFLQGWQTAVTKCIPQQKNDSDCGVFVLLDCMLAQCYRVIAEGDRVLFVDSLILLPVRF
uniref:SUMO specific peptidase 5 n=1 Tax=Leptobrachium leishanense TaxID=445787 RepID=A0A8C5M7F6_9ANUR